MPMPPLPVVPGLTWTRVEPSTPRWTPEAGPVYGHVTASHSVPFPEHCGLILCTREGRWEFVGAVAHYICQSLLHNRICVDETPVLVMPYPDPPGVEVYIGTSGDRLSVMGAAES